MRENGTDRDVALTMKQLITDCASMVTTINENLFVPQIITQPTDQTAAVGTNATFSISAVNVESYQWQYRDKTGGAWYNATGSGNNTDTMTIEATTIRYGLYFRCHMVGKDGSEIDSDLVSLIQPET